MDQHANVEEEEYLVSKFLDTVAEGGIPCVVVSTADAATPSSPAVCEVHSAVDVACLWS